jgi:hypothetical protein
MKGHQMCFAKTKKQTDNQDQSLTKSSKSTHLTPMHEGDAFGDHWRISCRIGSIGLILWTSPARGYCWGRRPEVLHQRPLDVTLRIELHWIQEDASGKLWAEGPLAPSGVLSLRIHWLMNESLHLMIPDRTMSAESQQRPQVLMEMEATIERATWGWKRRPCRAKAWCDITSGRLTGGDMCHHMIGSVWSSWECRIIVMPSWLYTLCEQGG